MMTRDEQFFKQLEAEMSSGKVYCEDCEFYGEKIQRGVVRMLRCAHPHAVEVVETPIHRKSVCISPKDRNADNACPDFDPKHPGVRAELRRMVRDCPEIVNVLFLSGFVVLSWIVFLCFF